MQSETRHDLTLPEGSSCTRQGLRLSSGRNYRVDRRGLPYESPLFFVSLPRFFLRPLRYEVASEQLVQSDRRNLVESKDRTKNKEAALLGEVEAVVCPVLQAHGLDLFDLSFRVEKGGWVLRVTIEPPVESVERGVTLEQCAEVSRDISTALDVADPLAHAYTLEVSSPGVERPLRTLAHFSRFVGKPAKVTMRMPVEGMGMVLRGVIAGVDGESVLLDVGLPNPVVLALSDIKRANLVYELPSHPKKGNSKKKRRSGEERRD